MGFPMASTACAIFLLPVLAFARQGSPDDSVVHGTINVALGNESGLVVLTDSMITVDGRQQPEPGQKLFKLDDHTVCSFAGFASAPADPARPSVRDLNMSTSSIIHKYVRQSARQPPMSIAERLRTLSFLFKQHLTAIANVRDALGNPTKIERYGFQLIVAGFDLDGKPKIGRIALGVKNNDGALVSDVEDASISNIERKLDWKLNGMPEIAEQILHHPESRPNDAVLGQYATSVRENAGRSLTVKQMVELAKRLAYYTSQVHPEVGGPDQIATLENSHSVSIEQPVFPEPPKMLFNFALAVKSEFSYSSIAVAKGLSFVCVRCSWTGMQRGLDGNYFIENDFTKSFLFYDGGAVNLGDTNTVVDSVLVIGAHVKPDDETLRRLSKAFHWSRILRVAAKTTPAD
jgi:20S proteasome alpha/beta subunit